jgi:serine/threonine protein kinase/WD40 repeat protein/phage FluMu protein Com
MPELDADAIEQHVQECSSCNGKLADLLAAKDTLAGLLARDTESDTFWSSPIVIDHVKKIEHLRRASAKVAQQGNPMITISCSACQKKLSVKEALAGKKVKCPGCGQVTAVPAKVPAAAGADNQPPLPPAPFEARPRQDPKTPSPPEGSVGDRPTNPPLSKPDATQDLPAPGADHDTSLTDFLAPPQADDELGRLGDYRILKILGHGGMGVVFLGEDATLNRKVAIKAMLPHLAKSTTSRQRFLREARAAAALEHDHIVAIHHVGEDRGAPYIVMPFLKGQPLDERLKRDEPMPLADVLRIGREIAEGLAAAHAPGLIHRDIKPANIWLETPRDRVKILDFGLARAASQDSGLTQQGAVIGTPAYMAPEQGRGEVVDARCDLFSLGVVLYRMCTGKQPFHGNDTVSTLMSVAMHEPPPPISINLELPPELSDLVMKLLEKDVAQRLGSAGEVVQAIQQIEQEHAPKPTTQKTIKPKGQTTISATATAPPAKPKSRRRLVYAVAALGFASILLAGGIILYLQSPDGTVRIEINDPAIKVALDQGEFKIQGAYKDPFTVAPGAHGLRIKKDDFEFDTTTFAVKKGVMTTLKIDWIDGKVKIVNNGEPKTLSPITPADPDRRAAEWVPLFNGKDLTGWKLDPLKRGVWKVENGLLVGTRGHAYLFSERGDYDNFHVRLKAKLNAGGNSGLFFRTPFLMPDGFPPGYEAQIENSNHPFPTGSLWPIQKATKDTPIAPNTWFEMEVIARDNRITIKINGETSLEYVDKERRYSTGHLAIQCDDEATVIQVESIEIKRLPTGKGTADPLIREFKGHAGGVWSVDLSEDGRLAVSAGGGLFPKGQLLWKEGRDYGVRIWDARSGLQLFCLEGHTDIVRTVALSPDARQALSASWDKSIRLWDLQKGKEVKSFTGHTKPVTGAAFIPKSDRIASVATDGTLRVWDVKTGNQLQSFELALGELHAVAVSPDGLVAYCGTADRSVQIVDLASGKITGQLEGVPGLVYCVAVSADGRQAAAGNGSAPDCVGVLWETDSAKSKFKLTGHAVGFSRDGKRLIVGCGNGDVHVLDTTDGRILHRVPGHTNVTQGVAISADGTQVLSGSWDGTVKLWTFEPKAAADPDRKAAEWVPPIGGKVTVRVGDKEQEVRVAKDTSAGEFQVIKIDCSENPRITDAGLKNLVGLKNLNWLNLCRTTLTDAGMIHLKGLTSIENIGLWETGITDGGLESLVGFKKLKGLGMSNTKITDAGMVHLKGLTSIENLGLRDTSVTDAGLKHLAGLESLRGVELIRTKVTADGVKKLSTALPGCKIESDHGIFGPKAAADPERKAATWVVSIGGAVKVNDQETEIKAAADLPQAAFRLTAVSLGTNKQVSDAGLAVGRADRQVARSERGAAILRSIKTLETINGQLAAAFWNEVHQKKP